MQLIIGLTGRIASGKGVIADFLKEKGLNYTTVSSVVRKEAFELGLEITRTNLQNLGNSRREEFGAGYWMKKIIETISPNENYVIDGIRNPGEIDELKKLASDNRKFYLIAIDSPFQERFRRMLNRAKLSDPKNLEEFIKIDERDFVESNPLGQQVGKCMKQADYLINNSNSLEEFRKNIEEVYLDIIEKDNETRI
jgi:dephospho-CoA kinase